LTLDGVRLKPGVTAKDVDDCFTGCEQRNLGCLDACSLAYLARVAFYGTRVSKAGAAGPDSETDDDDLPFPPPPPTGRISVHHSDAETYEIPNSMVAASGARTHFVTVKGSGDVTLQLALNYPPYVTYVKWKAVGGHLDVSTDHVTASLKRNKSKKVEIDVSVVMPSGPTTIARVVVWVIWSTLKAAKKKNQESAIDQQSLGLQGGHVSDAPPRYAPEARVDWIARIHPRSILTDADRPALQFQQPVPAPQPNNGMYVPNIFSGWEVCESQRLKLFIKSAGRWQEPLIGEYPSGDVADYISDMTSPYPPYVANRPFGGNARIKNTLYDSTGADGDVQRWRRQFTVFVRVQLNDAWHRCSDYSFWRWHQSALRSNGRWDAEPKRTPILDLTDGGFDAPNK